jgi:excisionase family DNA binding protein
MELIFYTKRETGEVLRVGQRTIERMMRDGQLPFVRVRGQVRIPVAAIKKIAGEEKAAETA